MFEVGSAPAARWNPDQALEIVDQLIRDILLAAQQKARAKSVGQRIKRKGLNIINWVPDTWTLLALRKQTSLKEVIYPGDGLPKVELERLQRVFGDITFRSFEEELFDIQTSGREHPVPRHVVVFSVSEPLDSDLLRRGFTPAHLDDLHTRRAILRGSHTDLDGKTIGRRVAQVVFGGKLTNFKGVLPGILEEAMIAESFGIGLFVIGGFGGAAEALARFLATTEPLPPQMLANFESGDEQLATMQKIALERLSELFSAVRQRRDLRNGLTWEENLDLMQSSDGAKIVRLMSKGISGCLYSGADDHLEKRID
jgi:hypothetical protein